METVWELIKSALALILRALLIHFFGVGTRWLFFKAADRPKMCSQ
jgi:hypothetical protein